jgi:hypothetical protein
MVLVTRFGSVPPIELKPDGRGTVPMQSALATSPSSTGAVTTTTLAVAVMTRLTTFSPSPGLSISVSTKSGLHLRTRSHAASVAWPSATTQNLVSARASLMPRRKRGRSSRTARRIRSVNGTFRRKLKPKRDYRNRLYKRQYFPWRQGNIGYATAGN